MTALSSVSATSSQRNTSNTSFVSIGVAARYLSVCQNTVRMLCDTGEIVCFKSVGNHRRISSESLREYAYGEQSEESQAEKSVCVYLRVSSDSQNQAGSLDRQRERLLDEVSERELIPRDEIAQYSDVASSFGTRPKLNSLIDAIIDGRISRVYCEYLDRLSRIPSTTSLIEHLCKRFGVEIVCLDTEESDPEDLQTAMLELVNFAQILTARLAGRKAAKVTKKHLREETVSRILELRSQNLMATEIHRKLLAEGHTMYRADGSESPVSYAKVRSLLDSNGTERAVSKIMGQESHDYVSEWKDSSLFQVGGTTRVSVQACYLAYCDWCKERGVSAQNKNRFSTLLGIKDKQKGGRNGTMFFVGWTLNANAKRVECGGFDEFRKYNLHPVEDGSVKTSVKDIYDAYVSWSQNQDAEPENAIAIGRRLNNLPRVFVKGQRMVVGFALR